MRRKIIRIAAGLFLFAAFMIPTSCEFGDDCAWCTQVSQKEGEEPVDGIAWYYCDEELNEKRNSTPVTFLGTTKYWECD